MAGEAELLAAIKAAPQDDVVRLVYADWLAEQGDPRGELIQLQVAQSRQHEGTPPWARLNDKINRLLGANEVWIPRPRFPPGYAEAEPSWDFLRGFPERVRTVPPAVIQAADALHEAAPLLWDVRLDCRRQPPDDPLGWVEQLAPRLGGFRQLGLTGANESSLIALAGRRELLRLRALSLEKSSLGAASLEALTHAASSILGLERLELSSLGLADAGLGRLFKGGFVRLKELSIQHERIGPRGAAVLGAIKSGPRKVDLRWCTVGDEAQERLFEGPLLAEVEQLNLSFLAVSTALAEWLHRPPPSLKVLRLKHARLHPPALAALREADALEQLELLDLSGVELDESAATALLARFGERVLFRSEG